MQNRIHKIFLHPQESNNEALILTSVVSLSRVTFSTRIHNVRYLFGRTRKQSAVSLASRRVPLLHHPDPALRQLAASITAQNQCPVCEKDGHIEPCKAYCPDCGLPSHCSTSHRQADTSHKEEGVCEALQEWYDDETDLRSLRTQQSLSAILPRERSDWMALNLNDWYPSFWSVTKAIVEADMSQGWLLSQPFLWQ